MLILAAAAVATPAPTAAPREQLCVPRRQVRSIVPDGPKALRFVGDYGPSYRARVPGGCDYNPRLMSIVTSSTTDSFCAGDALRLVDFVSGFNYGACVVEAFEVLPPAAGGRR